MFKQLLPLLATLLVVVSAKAQQPNDIRYVVAAIEKDKFHGWPANNGAWQWGDEFLVGFTQGDFGNRDGHNILGIQQSMFTRSTDGGLTWRMFDPESFLDDENVKWLPKGKMHLSRPINFQHAGFAMRVVSSGYHGNDDPMGGFYYSYNRGVDWEGPYFLGDINNDPELKGKIIAARTDYLVMSDQECFVFIAAHDDGKPNRLACIKTSDGGMTFDFVSWVTLDTTEYTAIMSSTIHLADSNFLLAFRKINRDKSQLESTIDTYSSVDRCENWTYHSTVKEIKNNSNPPAMVQLDDGRLCCVYGDRDVSKICGKYSADGGKTWGAEFDIRSSYAADDDWSDMGYPRLLKRSDGRLVAIYYWSSPVHPQQYIEAAIWTP